MTLEQLLQGLFFQVRHVCVNGILCSLKPSKQWSKYQPVGQYLEVCILKTNHVSLGVKLFQ